MEHAFKKRKIKVQYETPAMELIRDVKTGEVRSVIAESKGKKLYVKAKKAVVMCTGGFENNQEMIRDYLGMPYAYPKGSPYNTGDSCMDYIASADFLCRRLSKARNADAQGKVPLKRLINLQRR